MMDDFDLMADSTSLLESPRVILTNMAYWSDLFTPETYEAFGRSDRTISGFRESQHTMAEKVSPGDKFICYMVRMS